MLDDGLIVEADALIVHAAAFLDTMPLTERVSPEELAAGIDIPIARAAAILDQLVAPRPRGVALAQMGSDRSST